MTLTESEDEVIWLTGEKVKPWVYYIEFDQKTCPKVICYKYSIYDKDTQILIYEREPNRWVDLEDPNNYFLTFYYHQLLRQFLSHCIF